MPLKGLYQNISPKVNTKDIVVQISAIVAEIGYRNTSGSKPRLYVKNPSAEENGTITITDSEFATKHVKNISIISREEDLNINNEIKEIINVPNTLEIKDWFIIDARIR